MAATPPRRSRRAPRYQPRRRSSAPIVGAAIVLAIALVVAGAIAGSRSVSAPAPAPAPAPTLSAPVEARPAPPPAPPPPAEQPPPPAVEPPPAPDPLAEARASAAAARVAIDEAIAAWGERRREAIIRQLLPGGVEWPEERIVEAQRTAEHVSSVEVGHLRDAVDKVELLALDLEGPPERVGYVTEKLLLDVLNRRPHWWVTQARTGSDLFGMLKEFGARFEREWDALNR